MERVRLEQVAYVATRHFCPNYAGGQSPSANRNYNLRKQLQPYPAIRDLYGSAHSEERRPGDERRPHEISTPFVVVCNEKSVSQATPDSGAGGYDGGLDEVSDTAIVVCSREAGPAARAGQGDGEEEYEKEETGRHLLGA